MPGGEKMQILAIVGATASGKTALGVQMAKRFNGEVVSADSMQIYKGMDIATAKPTVEEMQGVTHHLLDFLPVTECFSVARYVELAKHCISDIDRRGKLPVVVGGTGLYINSLIDNIEFVEYAGDEEYRNSLAERAREYGAQSLLDELKERDPQTAEKLHPNNLGRIIRALEIYEMTGLTMSEQVERSRKNPSPYQPVMIGIDYRDREKLYARINKRVDEMMTAGLVEEALIYRNNVQRTAAQAIGYKELEEYFEGRATLDEATENLKMQTRRYAKRQLTWFRRDKRIHWIYADEFEDGVTVFDTAAEIFEAERGNRDGN